MPVALVPRQLFGLYLHRLTVGAVAMHVHDDIVEEVERVRGRVVGGSGRGAVPAFESEGDVVIGDRLAGKTVEVDA